MDKCDSLLGRKENVIGRLIPGGMALSRFCRTCEGREEYKRKALLNAEKADGYRTCSPSVEFEIGLVANR